MAISVFFFSLKLFGVVQLIIKVFSLKSILSMQLMIFIDSQFLVSNLILSFSKFLRLINWNGYSSEL